jgi:hypothetical protein
MAVVYPAITTALARLYVMQTVKRLAYGHEFRLFENVVGRISPASAAGVSGLGFFLVYEFKQ